MSPNLSARITRRLADLLPTLRRISAALLLVPILPLAADGATVDYSSRVDGAVSGTGPFTYQFEVFNTTPIAVPTFTAFAATVPQPGDPVIVDWELPYFSLSEIQSIASPTGWTYDILSSWTYDADNDPVLAGNPGLYGPNPEVFETAPYILHWFTTDAATYGIAPGGSLAGFSFVSDYNSQSAPYLSSWEDLPPITGDPPSPETGFGTPDSPARQQAQRQGSVVPEPSSLAMFAGIGLCGLARRIVRRRRA